MIVVSQNDTSHTIKVILRDPASVGVNLTLTNDITKVVSNVSSTFVAGNRDIKITFDFNFSESDSYSLYIKDDNSEVIYRDLLFATNQETQKFRLTEGKYYF